MKSRRFLLGNLGACLLASMSLSGCSSGEEVTNAEDTASAREAIIAGVNADSSTLNAVGSLVRINRYTYCPFPYSCGTGGSAGYAGKGGYGGTTVVPGGGGAVVPITNPLSGRLDLPSMPVAGTGGSTGVAGGGGVIPAGGRTGKGGAPSYGGVAGAGKGGAPSYGGVAGTGTTQPVVVVTYTPFCSGTLVGPTAVLTAEHCLQNLEYYYAQEVGFAVGPDARNPVAVYPIVDWDWEAAVPNDYNNLLGDLGSDVGVAHLGAPVMGITPLAISSLTAADVGRRFTALGYGVQNNNEANGTRKAGSVTLRGIGGNYADYAFGGLDGFLKVAPTMPAFSGYPPSYLVDLYNRLGLIPDYQAFFGGKPGDAQPCFGDSGGPIIAMRNGVRTVFGNITNGFGSNRLICDYGAVAAVFGPLTLEYLAESLQWVDPCAGATVQGHCDGDVAIRCTNRLEGERRLSETDCSLIGQTCGIDASGAAACVDPA